jgi:hypothetical protein
MLGEAGQVNAEVGGEVIEEATVLCPNGTT